MPAAWSAAPCRSVSLRYARGRSTVLIVAGLTSDLALILPGRLVFANRLAWQFKLTHYRVPSERKFPGSRIVGEGWWGLRWQPPESIIAKRRRGRTEDGAAPPAKIRRCSGPAGWRGPSNIARIRMGSVNTTPLPRRNSPEYVLAVDTAGY